MNALALALLDFVWQGALVGCAAAVLLALMGGARPQARYAVACAALLLCAALPLAGMLAYLDGDVGAMQTAAWPGAARAGSASAPALDAGLAANPGAGAGPGTQGWQDALQLQLRPRLPLVILCWAIGAAVLACRLLLGLAWVRRRSRPGAYRCDPAWQAVLDRLAARLGIGRRVVLGLVDDAGAALAGPVTAGWWRPLVLVPAALASGMAPHLLEALLAHELAHVRRHDYLVNLMQSAIEVLLFYHPAVWWLSHRIRLERELVADDLAASMLGEPRRLALALSELDLFQLSTHHLAPAAHGGNLMSRIKQLVRPQSEPINWKLALPLLGLALSAAVVAGTAQAERQAAPLQQAQQQAQQQVQQQAVQAERQARSAEAQAQAAATQAAGQADAASRQAERAASRAARAAARGERTHIHHVSESGYALVQGDREHMKVSGDGSDTGTLLELHHGIDGEFLWFRDGGKSWVVQDPAVLARAHAAYAPMERLGEQMNAYGKQMDRHGKAMDVLGQDMSRAAAGMQPDQARLQVLQTKMNGLGRQMGKLGGQMGAANDDERRRLDGDMRRLSAQMSELGAQMGEAGNPPSQRAAKESMDEIGRRMNEAGKPMDALGKQMNVLGKQMEEEGKTADKTMRALIQDAQARGLARQVPQG